MGYLYAFTAFALIGSYMVPTRFAAAKGMAFLPYMALGLLVLDLGLIPQVSVLWAHPVWFWGSILTGVLWAVGQGLANAALAEISLAKASVFFNINSFINIAFGILVFHEAAGLKAYLLLLAGGILLSLGAWLVARVSASPKKEGNLKKGITLSLLAGFFWAIYFVPVQWIQRGSEGDFTPALALSGMILGGGIPSLLAAFPGGVRKGIVKDLGLGFLTALLWLGGTLFFLKANQSLGLSRAVPIVNSSVLIYAGWSLFFKELPLAQWPKVLGGALTVAAGVLLMALSQ